MGNLIGLYAWAALTSWLLLGTTTIGTGPVVWRHVLAALLWPALVPYVAVQMARGKGGFRHD